mmetsp:Transcript_11648/g.11581  ORF Transcript_11648/g.11581 Transcript_11648/m.11581 type:complete len:134 (-) Transcript_11648:1468-1869(-)
MNAEKEEKHAPFFSNSSKTSEKAPSGLNIRRSKRLGSRKNRQLEPWKPKPTKKVSQRALISKNDLSGKKREKQSSNAYETNSATKKTVYPSHQEEKSHTFGFSMPSHPFMKAKAGPKAKIKEFKRISKDFLDL